MIDTKELRQLAQDATPGPWEVAYTVQNGQAVEAMLAAAPEAKP